MRVAFDPDGTVGASGLKTRLICAPTYVVVTNTGGVSPWDRHQHSGPVEVAAAGDTGEDDLPEVPGSEGRLGHVDRHRMR